MHTVSAEQKILLDKDLAWQLLSDLSQAGNYVPGLTGVEFTTDIHSGIGTSRRVTRGKSFALDETVEAWEPGALISLRLHRGDKGPIPPLKSHFFDYRIEQRGEAVYLVNSMRYEVGLGWLGSALNALLLRRVMLLQLRDVTLAQKLFYESGDKVTPATLKAARLHCGV